MERRVELTPSEIGRLLVAQRRTIISRCVVCGVPIESKRPRRYCSNRCKMADRRQRQKAAKAQGQAAGPSQTPTSS